MAPPTAQVAERRSSGWLGRVAGRVRCMFVEHAFVVWVRPDEAPSPRHPHLGTWSRCERCGEERDWLFASVRPPLGEEQVVNRVHGGLMPLSLVIRLARGNAVPEPRNEPATAGAGKRSSKPLRRDRALRQSTSRNGSRGRVRPSEPRD